MSDPVAETVEQLLNELQKLPKDARVLAYEGESIGLAIRHQDGRDWFIKTPTRAFYGKSMTVDEFDAEVARRKRLVQNEEP